MSPCRPPAPLLETIPFGGLLGGVLRVLLTVDQREEFLGDLVEEGNLRLRVSSPGQVAAWMWLQILRSTPPLVGWRIRRLAARAQPLPSAGGVLVAWRAGHRGWTLSLAMSLSAHVLVLMAVGSWVFSRIEELDPPSVPVNVAAMLFQDETAPVKMAEVLDPGGPVPSTVVQARSRRSRGPRRPLPQPVQAAPAAAASPEPIPQAAAPVVATATATDAPPAAAPEQPAAMAHGRSTWHAAGLPLGHERRVRLPPRVVEKRCLSCPPPQLPHPYARLGVGQEMVVKTCVNVRGEVSSVDVVRGLDPLVNTRVAETIRTWRLAPYSLDGHPVPFCYTTRFLFTTH